MQRSHCKSTRKFHRSVPARLPLKLVTMSAFLGFGLSACVSSGGDTGGSDGVDMPSMANVYGGDAGFTEAPLTGSAGDSYAETSYDNSAATSEVGSSEDASDSSSLATMPTSEESDPFAALDDPTIDSQYLEPVNPNSLQSETIATTGDIVEWNDQGEDTDNSASQQLVESADPGSGFESGIDEELRAVAMEESSLVANAAEEAQAWTASSEFEAYIVQPGETLNIISSKVFGTARRWQELAEANQLAEPFVIYPGQQIRFAVADDATRTFAEGYRNLPQQVVEVEQGDTLSSLAERIYGNSNHWKILASMNQTTIPDPDNLEPGAVLHYVSPDVMPMMNVEKNPTYRGPHVTLAVHSPQATDDYHSSIN